jgi:hypothetical protein
MRLLRMMMCIMVVAPLFLYAQESDQETLFGGIGDIEHGGYGCAVAKVSPVHSKAQLFMGGYGGWLINHTFMIGFGGYGMTSSLSASDEAPKLAGKTPYVGMGYGGLMLEYTVNSDKLVHFTGQLLVGAGGAGYSWGNQLFDTTEEFNNNSPSDSYFAAEFGANVELNVASFFRVGAGGSYRFVSGLKLEGLTDKDLSGPSGNITFKFGKF